MIGSLTKQDWTALAIGALAGWLVFRYRGKLKRNRSGGKTPAQRRFERTQRASEKGLKELGRIERARGLPSPFAYQGGPGELD